MTTKIVDCTGLSKNETHNVVILYSHNPAVKDKTSELIDLLCKKVNSVFEIVNNLPLTQNKRQCIEILQDSIMKIIADAAQSVTN